MRRISKLIAGAAFAAVLPLSVSFSPTGAADLIQLNTACAAAEGGLGCKLNLLHICETANNDHRFYRNVTGSEIEEVQVQ